MNTTQTSSGSPGMNRPTPRSNAGRSGTIQQLFRLLWEKKAWWLLPMIIVFGLVGSLIILGQGSALSPFIYTLF